MNAVRRCAVYTRKSSEEGLEQSFNSLHAQREACEAFIKSQAHEGWELTSSHYDDGGFSGGTLERPALKRLLHDLEQGLIDVIVVYKVDRLTRSLTDFAKIVERLDSHNASFVSITQQFNTTTSMGRLTLNVLLSFAQFERELASERIRDKIAASKRRGMWMGGNAPLGYDVRSRRLEVNVDEAGLVQRIFLRYLELGCVASLQNELAAQGIKSKVLVSTKGTSRGGGLFTRTMLYRLLANPTYIGRVPHKSTSYPGGHEAIVEAPMWEKVQALLASNRRARSKVLAPYKGSPLGGLLFDDRGNLMTPSFATKGASRRYRYYVSQAILQNDKSKAGSLGRVPAAPLEAIVANAVRQRLKTPSEPPRNWHKPGDRPPLRQWVERVTLSRESIEILFRNLVPNRMLLRGVFVRHGRGLSFEELNAGRTPVKRWPSLALIKALGRAHHWRKLIESGEIGSYCGLARHERMNPGYVRRLLQLSFLSPLVVEAILAGHPVHPGGVVDLTALKIPLSWTAQRALLLKD
jgi:site-specific DNA recombinase